MSKAILSGAMRLHGISSVSRLGIARIGFSKSGLGIKPLSTTQKFRFLNSQRFNSTSATAAVENITDNAASSPSIASEITNTLPSITELAETGASGSDAFSVCDHVGYLSDLGIVTSWWWPADFLARILEMSYVFTGLPWWANIALVTFSIRLAMFPLYLKSSDTTAKMSEVREQLDHLNEQSKLYSNDPEKIQFITAKRMDLFRKKGIKLRYMAAPLVQIPFALGMFGAIRKMAAHPVDGFTEGGFAWFTDLAATDPYLGLQFLTAGAFMAFMRIGGETGTQNLNPLLKKVFTVLPLISIPLTMNLSAGIIWYFALNGVFSIIQTTLLKSDFIRKKFNLAKIVPPQKNADGSSKQKGIFEMWEDSKIQAENKKKLQDYQNQVAANMQKSQAANNRILRKSAFKKTIVK